MARLNHITGLEPFLAAIDQLPKNIGRNVLRGAVNAGATVLRKEAVLLAPEYEGKDPRPDPGKIKRAIYQRQIQELSSDLIQTVFVGVKRGKKSTVKIKGSKVSVDAYYWTWIEFGHYYVPPQPHVTGGKLTQEMWRNHNRYKSNAVWVEPHPFMAPAFANKKDEALQAMIRYLERRIPGEAKKLGLTMK